MQSDEYYLKEIRGNIVKRLSALGNITVEQGEKLFAALEELRNPNANIPASGQEPMRTPE